MQNLGEGPADIGMKLARQRLEHLNDKGKPAPLCLACGQPATNELPTCNSLKCRAAVRPVYRWAKRVAGLTTTQGVRLNKKAA